MVRAELTRHMPEPINADERAAKHQEAIDVGIEMENRLGKPVEINTEGGGLRIEPLGGIIRHALLPEEDYAISRSSQETIPDAREQERQRLLRERNARRTANLSQHTDSFGRPLQTSRRHR